MGNNYDGTVLTAALYPLREITGFNARLVRKVLSRSGHPHSTAMHAAAGSWRRLGTAGAGTAYRPKERVKRLHAG